MFVTKIQGKPGGNASGGAFIHEKHQSDLMCFQHPKHRPVETHSFLIHSSKTHCLGKAKEEEGGEEENAEKRGG